ncbi:Utilization protein for unknown catechol-siderophore X [Marinobacterium lacunae]|uniref:FAD-binding FR-type domain-containing protein n=1 Tax=Marinobacterium lacunae TaxID=1232683 RepID=A0A081FX44_9GAMM|nr:siderophore-interacting protein [Marinobacterium lacunae]KEA63099.1 Utilization protein for unknown catechol-siderophore X [Marinobacterium lacunae]
MNRPAPRELTLLYKQQLSPHMLRLTLGGKGMGDFPTDQASAYVKLMLPRPGSDHPVVRTYTVRADRESNKGREIDIDFVIHKDAGPASSWAMASQPGDSILVGGPGPTKMVDHSADWFLFVGDMTALPAISANLERLPEDAQGHVVIEVIDADDIQTLKAPVNMELHWLVNPHPGMYDSLLLDKVQQLSWLKGRPSVWCACEFSSMRALRDHFRPHPDLTRDNLYISSYWKLGMKEEEHKAIKQAEAC